MSGAVDGGMKDESKKPGDGDDEQTMNGKSCPRNRDRQKVDHNPNRVQIPFVDILTRTLTQTCTHSSNEQATTDTR
jgi:hypothetical protein